MPIFVPLYSDFMRPRRLHLWPFLTDVFLQVYYHDTVSASRSPTERNVTRSGRVTEMSKPTVPFIQSIFLKKV